jgi:dienelactone hydrolase
MFSQEKVNFYASDSLKITADLYLNNYQSPFILLFHQSESSRGEFSDIAPRLQKLGYNCLAVDLRCGGKINYVENETAKRAHDNSIACRNIDALKDMQAALAFIRKFNRKPVILFGSSYSASLALLMAKKQNDIAAVVAFSPGEYFRPELSVKDTIAGLTIPVFVASTDLEAEYVSDLLAGIEDKYKTLFKPDNGRGVHGARALWNDSEESETCWFKLTRFIGNLGKI